VLVLACSTFQPGTATARLQGGQKKGLKMKTISKPPLILKQALVCTMMAVLLFATAAATAQTYTVLYNMGTVAGAPASPTNPGIIAQGRNGALYSVTPTGCGAFSGFGTGFSITPQGKVKVLGCLNQANDQAGPASGVTMGTDGNFYGSSNGGDYYGSVWKMSAAGKFTTYGVFSAPPNVFTPLTPPVLGMDGSFYGTAEEGGTAGLCTYGFGGCGGVYKIQSSGKGYKLLHSFDQTNGANPYAPLLLGTDGNFYGTMYYGGTVNGIFRNSGVVFKMTPSGQYTVLYVFCALANCDDGANPVPGLTQATDGNFYGTTEYGGTGTGGFRYGTIFTITPAGQLTVLYNFCSVASCTDGALPYGGLVQATDGNFYGTTVYGGTHNYGTIFQLTPSGKYTVLYNFDYTTGAYPEVTLVQHTNGILYGDTSQGGTARKGVFFSLGMSLPPFAKLVTWWGKVGSTVEILGQGFSGATSVSFNGTPATTFKATGDTYLTATVPAGATSGYVAVVTAKGTLTSNQVFHVQ
jgi:uncharacterized repeat protein (TIGR03803 family)